MVMPNPRQTYKALLLDYDALLAASDAECCFSLSEREVQVLLAFVDYTGWKTRYIATETEIDQSLILRWQGNLARKLMSGCCPDDESIHRYLPDGTYQTSDDGGVTWHDDPTGDPRYSAPLAPPLPGTPGGALRCAAADNVRDQYKQMRDNTIALLTGGTTVLLIVAGLVGLIGSILAISVVGISFGVMLFTLAGVLLSLTPESVAEQIDDEALDTFRCIVYCNLDENGRVRVGGFDDILSRITSQFDTFPETFFYTITASLTATGINNAATMGVATASDCDECDCGLNLIWTAAPGQVTSGTVVFQGADIWRVTLGTRDFEGITHSEGAFADDTGQCFKVTNIDLVAGSYTRSYRGLCGGGEGYGSFLDVCVTGVALDRYLADPEVESVIVDITAELC